MPRGNPTRLNIIATLSTKSQVKITDRIGARKIAQLKRDVPPYYRNKVRAYYGVHYGSRRSVSILVAQPTSILTPGIETRITGK